MLLRNKMDKIQVFKTKKTRRSLSQTKSGFSIGGKIWLERNGELYIGQARARLLEQIDELGSIAAAARSMKLAYRNAWLWVESMNRLAMSPLVVTVTGGPGGRHAVVTKEGWKAIEEYKDLRTRFIEFLDQPL